MLAAKNNVFLGSITNQGTISTTSGTSVVPGASNAEGSWTQLLAAISDNAWMMYLSVNAGATSAVFKGHKLDIGIDTAGGTSYVEMITDVLVSSSPAYTIAGGNLTFIFPLFIPAGSSIACRIQGAAATAGTVNVGIDLLTKPSNPELIRVGQKTENIGNSTTSNATAITPGSSGANGSWTLMGTNTSPLFWLQLGIQCTNTALTAMTYQFDIAVGDGTNFQTVIERIRYDTTTTESIATQSTGRSDFNVDIPAGSSIYVRGSASGVPPTGWQCSIIGVN